jgi:hypothetical protein
LPIVHNGLQSYEPIVGGVNPKLAFWGLRRRAKPCDLPIEQASKFTLVSENRKGARYRRAPTLLALADEVIE